MDIPKSALSVMDVLWDQGDVPAKQLAWILADKIGWNKNTTYTVINHCIKKGLVRRTEPGFICHAKVSREEVQGAELNSLMDAVFKGSPKLLFSALVQHASLSQADIEELQHLITKLK